MSYDEHLISQAGGDGDVLGGKLARAILTSRRTKCIVYGNHTEGGKCAGCGL